MGYTPISSKISDFFKLLIENSTDIISVLSKEGTFLYQSSSSQRILKQDPELLKGKSLFDFVHPEDCAYVQEKIEYLINNPDNIDSMIYRYRLPDNTYRLLETTGQSFLHVSEIKGLVANSRDITEIRDTGNKLLYKIEIEKLIVKISTNFNRLESDQIDQGITDSLEWMGKFFKADRCYLFDFFNNGRIIHNTHRWCNKGIEHNIQNLQSLIVDEAIPWMAKIIRTGKSIQFSNINTMPEKEAAVEKSLLEKNNVKSIVVAPIMLRGNLTGFMGFDSVTKPKNWSSDVHYAMQIVPDIFANILEKKNREEELIELLFSRLSKKEKEILKLFSEGDEYKLIAKKQHVTVESIYKAFTRIRKKLNIEKSNQLMAWAITYFRHRIK